MNEEEIKDIESTEEEQVDTQEEVEQPELKYTDEDVDRIINKKVAEISAKKERELEDKLNEAEKLRKMNADEKAHYEAKKKDERIAELEAKLNRKDLETEATNMLAEHDILANEGVLSYVVRDNAEETQIAVNGFVDLVNELADKKVKQALAGKTPTKIGNTSQPVKKLSEMTYTEKVELKAKNPQHYQTLLEQER